MVSQFGSLGYTIMGKTADLTVVQKTIIDTLHKEGKPQTFIAKEAGCSQSDVSKHVNRSWVEGKSVEEKDAQPTERTAALWGLSSKIDSRIWVNFTRNGLRLGQGIKSHHTQTCQEFGYSCRIPLVKPLLNHRQLQRHLTWAKEKKNWTVAQWSKVLFSDESKFCISFGNQGPRVWRKGGEAHSPNAWRPVLSFHSLWWFGVQCHLLVLVHCVFENQRHCTRFFGAFWSLHFGALHASFCWPAF